MTGIPASRQEMLEDFAETARLARLRHQHGIALAAQRAIAEMLGFMQAPLPPVEEKIDPEAYRERICTAARAFGMVFENEVK